MLMPAALAAVVFFSPPARADFVFSLQPAITASAGSTGNTFDVLLTNTGSSPVTVGGFSWGIMTTDTDIIFTDADTSTTTAAYIFAGDSFDDINSFPLSTSTFPGQEVIASDLSNSGSGDSVAGGATVGVGRVMFDIANGATTGQFPVTFESGPAGLTDTGFNNLAFTTTDGTITITGTTTVPEPSQSGVLICVLAGLAILLQRRRTL
jgi:hypothetical protein